MRSGGATEFLGMVCLLDDVEIDPAKLNADILFDVPDEELERAATVATWQISTLGICTNWYTCGWPL